MRSLAVLILVLVAAVSNGGALGQLQREVDEAQQELEEATRLLDAAEVRREAVLADLTRAVAAFGEVTLELEGLAFEQAELRTELEGYESELRELRNLAEERAVAAYIAGGTGLLDALFYADGLHQLATSQRVLDDVRRRDLERAARLDELRGEIELFRAQYEAGEEGLRAKAAAVDTLVDELDILFSRASDEAMAAHTRVEEADADYQKVYTLLEEAIRLRRLGGPGVERWRNLVGHYFPQDRVEQALEVMACESRGNPGATHPLSDAAGLFQFMTGTWEVAAPAAGFAGASRYDPEANIAAAAWLVRFSIETGHPGGAWGRWTCRPVSSASAEPRPTGGR